MKRDLGDQSQPDEVAVLEPPGNKRLHLLKSRTARARLANNNNRTQASDRDCSDATPTPSGESAPPTPNLNSAAGPDYRPSGILDEGAVEKSKTSHEYADPLDASEPPEAAPYRLYLYEDHDNIKSTIRLDSKSKFVIGSSEKADIVVSHPSVGPQHAVIQFRKPESEIRLYILDLESVSGTLLNGKKIPAMRYVELLDKDVLQVGDAPTEYLLVDDNAQKSAPPAPPSS